MKNMKFWRTALVATLVLTIMLSVTGGTIAWFTDSVESGANVIKAGNLDVELYNEHGSVEGSTELFKLDDPNLWEPGMVAYENLTIKNVGNLHLWYDLGVNFANANTVVAADGTVTEYSLDDVLQVALVPGEITSTDRAVVLNQVKDKGQPLNKVLFEEKPLAPNAEQQYAVVIFWLPGTDDNNWNLNNGKTASSGNALTIDLGIKLEATQVEAEKDSFGSDYDEAAKNIVTDAKGLNDALAKGGAVMLGADIKLAEGESLKVPAGAKVKLDLAGHTIEGGFQAGSTEKHVYAIENQGELTLANGIVNARGVSNYGKLTVESGTYNAVDDNGGGAIWNYAGGEVVINGGTFTAADDEHMPGAVCLNNAAGAKAVINGGKFRGGAKETYGIINYGELIINDADVNAAHGAIANEAGASTIINDGVFGLTYSGHTVYAGGGNVVINGGTFNGTTLAQATAHGDAVLYAAPSKARSVAHKIVVNGGTFNSQYAALTYSGHDIQINGGVFNGQTKVVYRQTSQEGIAEFVPSGYSVIGEDANHVVKGEVKSTDTTGLYESADGSLYPVTEDAMATAFNKKDAVVILPKGEYTDIPSIAEGVTIDGNGSTFADTLSGTMSNTTIKNVTFSAGSAQRWAYSNGDLVFENVTFDAKSVYAIHYDGLNGANITYKNCKIVGWVAIGSGANSLTFEDCEIYGNGRYGVIRCYSDATIKNCTFDVADVNTTDAYQDGIHAVDCTITVIGGTNVNGTMQDLANVSGTGVVNFQ